MGAKIEEESSQKSLLRLGRKEGKGGNFATGQFSPRESEEARGASLHSPGKRGLLV